MNTAKIIGDNIKEYRKKYGYSQDNIAALLKVDRSLISHYETGTREISLINLRKIADLFGIDIEDMVKPETVTKELNLAFALRAQGINENDLESIAEFQKVIKNYLTILKIKSGDE